MAAIITDEFRKNNIETFVKDVEDSPALDGHNYYLGIGKTDPWPAQGGVTETSSDFEVRFPSGSIDEKDDIKNNLMTLIKIDSTDIHRLVPKVDFRIGEIYKIFDPTDPTCFDYDTVQNHLPCYATYTDTDGHTKIYMCLGNNGFSRTATNIPAMDDPADATSNFPFGVKQNTLSAGGDGYIWAYLDYLNDDDPNNLFADSKSFQSLSKDSEIDRKVFNELGGHAGVSDGRTRATRASAGLLYGFKIVNGGSGYPVPAGQTSTTLTAKIIGERIKNDSDDFAQERIGNAITAAEDNDVTVTVVQGPNGGVVQSVEWDLSKAKQLGFGRTDSVDSEGNAVTGLTRSDVNERGGILRASLVITDPSIFESNDELKAEIVEADIRPLIAPQFGFGHSVLTDLPSYYAGISADFEGTIGENKASAQDSPPRHTAEALVDVSFRQVSLLREKTGEPIRTGEDDSPWPDPLITPEKAVNCLPYFFVPFKANQEQHTQVPASLAGKGGDGVYVELAGTVSGGGEKPKAWVDKISPFYSTDPVDNVPQTPETDTGGGFRIYYHQNSDKRINKAPFPRGESEGVEVNIYDSAGTLLTDSINEKCFYTFIGNPEYERTRGEVIFAENRTPIRRDAQQTEEVRLIIQF